MSDPTHTIYVGGSNPSASEQLAQQPPAAKEDEKTAPPTDNNSTSPAEPQPQPAFNQIIDVVSEWQRGNFLPALHCLRYNLIPKDFYDYTGYNILHHAVSQASIPVILILLDYFKFDVNIRSKNDQTSLMIACNYGYLEIIRILVERGAQINEQDNTKFSALLYSVKQGRIPQIAYLLHHKADINVRDANGCTAVHWAAYKNNVFLLKLFKRLGLDLNTVDTTGMTPLDRAVQSEGFEATLYLLENGDGKVPPNMKFDQINSNDMKEVLRKKFQPTKIETTKKKVLDTFKAHSQNITFGTYAVLWSLMMIVYTHVVMGSLNYTFDMLFFLFSLYFIIYAFWYYLKSHSKGNKKVYSYDALNKTMSAEDALLTATSRPTQQIRLNYEALDRLTSREPRGTVIHEGETQAFPTFLHEITWQFESKSYKELSRFDEKECCPECLTRRPPRSAHVEECQTCVPNFHHYSYTLGASIDHSNHFLYLVLVIQQQLLLFLFLVGIWSVDWARMGNKKIWFVECGYFLLIDYGLTYTLTYVTLLALSVYNFVFSWIELYGVAKNVTYYEMFNRNSCPYMFKVKQEKKGNFVKHYDNPFDHGVKENVMEYVNRILHHEENK